jgi:hypothetical protein
MSSSIVSPFPFFTDTTGAPLEGGYIYIGQSNLNPETAPVNVFWDAALTIPAANPVRTVGGYPSRQGTPSRFYSATDTYSITVRNKNRVLVFSAFDQSDAPTSVFDISTQLITATAGQTTFTLTVFSYLPGTDTLQVFRNGLRLNLGLDYLETNSVTITLTAPAAVGDQFLFQGGAVITGDQTPGSSVAFIQAGAGAVTRNMQDKARESVSVKDFGAVGNGIADDTLKIQDAINSLASTGGDVVFPFGTYKTTGTIRISSNRTSLVFQDGAKLLPVGNFDSIRFESQTSATFIYGNKIVNGLLDETGKTGGRTLVARYVAESNFELNSGNGYDGVLIDTFNTVDLTARLTNYTATVCDYVRVQGGASGQARSDVLRIHSLVMGGNYVDGQDGLVIDGFVHTVSGTHVYAINVGGKPLHALNSVGATDIPSFLTFFDLETDYCKSAVYLQTCQVVELVACTINGARADHGVFIGNGCIDARINGGRFTGSALAGIAVSNAGTIIRGAKLAFNSSNVSPVTGTLNTYPGILIGGTSSGVVVTGCRSGDAATSTFQRHGIQIDTGATNFIVSNNDVRDNATSGIADGSTATNGFVLGNNGYTGNLSAFVAGSSPYTYTAGHSPESVYIYGGTVSSITLGGATVFSSTDRTVHLGPNQSVVITHSAAPTILKMPQ